MKTEDLFRMLLLLFVLLFRAPFVSNSHADQLTLSTSQISSCGLSPETKATSWTLPLAKEGEPASAAFETLPWQVSIQTQGKHFCGGAILSNWWILSAAHCFQRDLTSGLFVVVNIEGGTSEERELDRVLIHHDFNGKTLYSDLALLLLDTPIDFSRETTPICLPLLHDLSMWQDCWVATWEPKIIPDSNEKQPAMMMEKIDVTLIGSETCAQKIPDLTENVLCTSSEKDTDGECKDESGNPLVCTYGSNFKWFVVGIASRGEGCEENGSPSVYTNIFKYLDWIEKATATEGKPFIPEGVDDLAIRTEIAVRNSAPAPRFITALSIITPVLILIVFNL
nr:PREDICTED: serine protease 55 [Anolis carolinensis]|eukprot:XP_016848453.1 PREDICTED: serine protease 55 [Anolis carolinensis]